MLLDIGDSTLLITNTFDRIFSRREDFASERRPTLPQRPTGRGVWWAERPFSKLAEGIRSHRFLSEWCCRFSWDLNPKRVDCKQGRWMSHWDPPSDTHFPLINSKIRMPSDQQSAAISWPLFRMISGATYSEGRTARLLESMRGNNVPGVPQNVQVFRPSPTFFAKPKSTWGEEEERSDQLWTILLLVKLRLTLIVECHRSWSLSLKLSRPNRMLNALDRFLSRGACLCNSDRCTTDLDRSLNVIYE